MRNRIVVALLLALTGCLSDENDIKATVGLGQDTGSSGTADASDPGDTGPACELPTEGFGTGQGALFDPNVKLKDCGGKQVTLGELMCGKKLTLVDIGAGWCEPCQEQAETLDEEIYEPFRDKGLQVISILFEDGKHLPANVEFCNQWTQTYTLTSPVLIDPTFRLKPFFTNVSSSTPVILLVDDTFTIVYERSGEAPKDLVQTIEAELAK